MKEIIKHNKAMGVIVLMTLLIVFIGSLDNIANDPLSTLGAFLAIAIIMGLFYFASGYLVVKKLKRKGKI